jgi:hypothetical protein
MMSGSSLPYDSRIEYKTSWDWIMGQRSVLASAAFIFGSTWFCGVALADAKWEQVGTGPGVSLTVDITSKAKTPPHVKAWVAYQFESEQEGNAYTGFKKFTRVVSLVYVNCKAQTSADVQVQYQNGDAYIGGYSGSPSMVAFWTASSSMAGKTTFILAGWTGMNVVG